MRKLIGITADVLFETTPVINEKHADFVPRDAVNAVLATGGIPVSLPHLPADQVDGLLSRLDGIIFTGGPDIDPTLFGEDPVPALGLTYRPRDLFEVALAQHAVAQHIPILGICRGMQIINVALGGTLYQDLASQYPSDYRIQHHQQAPGNLPTHHVTVGPSALQRAVGPHPFVNSRHHQAIKTPAPGVRVVARANDGVIEGIETPNVNVQGVQWHPENMWAEDPRQRALFQAFVDRLN
ncbi:gamma-glutamyl-gamma-aminobutyrate hydrolase family protein [Levilactobacillus acidifarinae]|uniref:Glutamine amidotransferase n=1 Tax=Levilactobacillus acidifarinae DSM 19394 = JCM 15949 TaxID=1423715 RepID=A0A0R1LRY6_9LACO|nr:gamma-glutamyl-gamma-aminobutyrate hydrolase family protein [Levilactobacillus acidifarinae]KRK95545.1 glutamine amidotransferase [Levilactobacillus acidifarinae DSM 19394]GEO70210.1 gamma-glutamyl-gamma-aminobutyrate hydrolase [Levilactobacillus acidifarinae]